MKEKETTVSRINDSTIERLKLEDEIRAPMIQQITDALPIFVKDDFASWTTDHITDLLSRVKRGSTRSTIDAAYVKVE